MVYIEYHDNGARLVKEDSQPIRLSGGFGSTVGDLISSGGYRLKEFSIQIGKHFVPLYHEPELIERVHQSFADEGAEILTLDTFNAGISRKNGNRVASQTHIAAAHAIAERVALQNPEKPLLLAGSIAPAGDCYKPEDTPDNEQLIKIHRQNIELIKEHCDFMLFETLPTLEEGIVFAELAQEAQKPFLVSFVVDEQGQLLNGNNIEEAVRTILKPHSCCLGIAVNCCTKEGAEAAVTRLSAAFARESGLEGKHIGAYPNGYRESRKVNDQLKALNPLHVPETFAPEEFARLLRRLVSAGATMIGGCCGAAPEHMAACHDHPDVSHAAHAHNELAYES